MHPPLTSLTLRSLRSCRYELPAAPPAVRTFFGPGAANLPDSAATQTRVRTDPCDYHRPLNENDPSPVTKIVPQTAAGEKRGRGAMQDDDSVAGLKDSNE